jgi:hypothetical protein
MKLERKHTWNSRTNTVETAMRGLTRSLRSTFYKTYTYKKATFGTFSKKTKNEEKTTLVGKSLGKLVDKELEHYNNNNNSIKNDNKPYLKHTSTVIDRINRMGYTLIHTQLPVANASLRLCTCLDAVVWCGVTKSYIVLEIKTGYARYKYRHTGNRMAEPLQSYTDCPNNQHILQTVCGEMLFKHTYPNILATSSQLWYVEEDLLTIEYPPKLTFNLVTQLSARLLETKHQTKRKWRKKPKTARKRRKINK